MILLLVILFYLIYPARISEDIVVRSPPPSVKISSRHEISLEQKLAQLMFEYNTTLSMETARQYSRIVCKEAGIHQIDPIWILAIMWQESRFDTRVQSEAGARGLMQILPSTAREYGVKPDQLYTPEINIQLGIKYLAYLQKQFNGNLFLATTAYNQGIGNVKRGEYNTVYTKKVQRHYEQMKKSISSR
ncbi:lytic transglycosylase domain-containing protein [Moorella sp. E308F]|uniref:lytic transglycosylase domain-containing protein n=1 Tax=Moorella sp. E308F TaxID=2572682 RepID=UPI001C0EABFC|nr:lytic transglycosylase domain-containing protein [Moorella sp. E308F]